MKKQIKYIIPVILGLIILGGIIFLAQDYFSKSDSTTKIQEVVLSPQMKFEQNLNSFYGNENPDLQNAIGAIKSGNIQSAIASLEKLLNDNTFSGNDLDALKSLLVSSYLTRGSVYFQESENAIQARELLNSSSFSKETWFYNYYMGYSYEIESSFEQARAFYNEALKYGDNVRKSQTLNQIGHVFDLEGNLEEAYGYYERAYQQDSSNIQANLNLGRYHSRSGDLEEAKKYFEYVANNSENKILQSEVYYNLSTLSFYAFVSLDESIEYAEKSIELNPDYPLGYVALARGIIERDGAILDVKEFLDKALSLYPNLTIAHKNLGVYYYINEDFDSSVASFKKHEESSKVDITLMDNQRKSHSNEAQYFQVRSYALNGDVENSMQILKELIDREGKGFAAQFLGDLSIEDGPFVNIEEDPVVLEMVNNILLKYKK